MPRGRASVAQDGEEHLTVIPDRPLWSFARRLSFMAGSSASLQRHQRTVLSVGVETAGKPAGRASRLGAGPPRRLAGFGAPAIAPRAGIAPRLGFAALGSGAIPLVAPHDTGHWRQPWLATDRPKFVGRREQPHIVERTEMQLDLVGALVATKERGTAVPAEPAPTMGGRGIDAGLVTAERDGRGREDRECSEWCATMLAAVQAVAESDAVGRVLGNETDAAT